MLQLVLALSKSATNHGIIYHKTAIKQG